MYSLVRSRAVAKGTGVGAEGTGMGAEAFTYWGKARAKAELVKSNHFALYLSFYIFCP